MLKGRRILSYVLAAMLAAGAWAAEVAPDKKSVCAKLLRPMLLPSPPTDPGGALEDSIELSPQDQYMLQEVAPQIIQGDPAHPTAKLHYVAHPQLLPQLIAWLEQQRVQYRYLHYVNGKLKLNHLVSSFLTPESLLLGIYNQERSISPDLTWANISSFFHWQWWATKNSPAEFVFLQNIPAEIVPFKYGLKAWQEDFHNWQEMITNGRALADFVEYLQNNLGLYLHLDPCHGPVDARHRKYNQDATSKINPAIIAEMVIEAYENSSLQAIIDEYFTFIAHSKTPAPAQPARPANRLQQILAISPYFALQRFQELHKFIYQFENDLQKLGLALQTDAATAHSHLVPQASAAPITEDFAKIFGQIFTARYQAKATRDLLFLNQTTAQIAAHFAQKKSIRRLGILMKKFRDRSKDIAQSFAEIPLYFDPNRQEVYPVAQTTREDHAAEAADDLAGIVTPTKLQRRLPAIFNIYLQELAQRLNAELGWSASSPLALRYVGPSPEWSNPQKGHLRLTISAKALATVPEEEFKLSPLPRQHGDILRHALAYGRQVLQAQPELQKIDLLLGDLQELDKQNTPTENVPPCGEETAYSKFSAGSGQAEIGLDVLDFTTKKLVASVATMAHEFHHLQENNQRVFFVPLYPSSITTHTLYRESFYFDEVTARLAELQYFEQVLKNYYPPAPLSKNDIENKVAILQLARNTLEQATALTTKVAEILAALREFSATHSGGGHLTVDADNHKIIFQVPNLIYLSYGADAEEMQAVQAGDPRAAPLWQEHWAAWAQQVGQLVSQLRDHRQLIFALSANLDNMQFLENLARDIQQPARDISVMLKVEQDRVDRYLKRTTDFLKGPGHTLDPAAHPVRLRRSPFSFSPSLSPIENPKSRT